MLLTAATQLLQFFLNSSYEETFYSSSSHEVTTGLHEDGDQEFREGFRKLLIEEVPRDAAELITAHCGKS